MIYGQDHPTRNAPDPRQTPRRRWKLVAGWTLLALVALGAASRRWRRVQVAGDSMLPGFQPGDRLLVGPAVPHPPRRRGGARGSPPRRASDRKARPPGGSHLGGCAGRQPGRQHRQPSVRPGGAVEARRSRRLPLWPSGADRLVAGPGAAVLLPPRSAGGSSRVASGRMPSGRVTDQPRSTGSLLPMRSPAPGLPAGARLQDVDEWGRSERARTLLRRLFDPVYRDWFRAEWAGPREDSPAGRRPPGGQPRRRHPR